MTVADHAAGPRGRNSTLNAQEFRRGATVLQSRPRMLFLELTQRCNLQCVMCRSGEAGYPPQDMSDMILERVRRELFPYVEAVDLRGNGESTLDSRLIGVAHELSGLGVRTHLYSNLTTNDPAYWRLLGNTLNSLGISIDTADPDDYESVRRGASFHKFLENLQVVSRCMSDRGLGATFSVHFSAVVLPNLTGAVPGLVRLAAQYKVPVVRLNPLTTRCGDAAYPSIGFSDPLLTDQLHAALNEASRLARDVGVHLELAASLADCGGGGFHRCLHPWSYVVVSADGHVAFCDHFVGEPKAEMGSLIGNTFMAVWNNAPYQDLRRQHRRCDFRYLRERGCECDWCYRNRYADCESRLEKEYMPRDLTYEPL